MNNPIQILQHYWKHEKFRPLQEDIINAVLQGDDTLALLPTGGGKSLCFQIPALAKEGICIVISPLIALMKDQVNALFQKDIKAIALTSGIPYQELDTLLDNCIYGNYKFLYLSPERLQQDIVKERIKQMNVNLIAIDEAHCISQWGNDFRPSYKKIKVLRDLKPTIPMIALTASATPVVVTDIQKELDLFQPKVFKSSFTRKNLIYNVVQTTDKIYSIQKILKANPGTSIIYVRNRKSTIDISTILNNQGIKSTHFHGGITNIEKNKRLDQWMKEEIKVMVATNAFGMGIDKSNVRTVIHINLPESIESYFQEAGRAGRDGNLANAILLKNENDITRVKNQFIDVLPKVDFVRTVYRKLCNYFQIPFGEGEQTKHNFDFKDFCKTYSFNTMKTYNVLKTLDRTSILYFSQLYQKKSSVQILASSSNLLKYLEQNPQFELIVKAMLRTYGGIFDEEININLYNLAAKATTTENEVIRVLKKLEDIELLTFNHSKTDAEITFLVPREDDSTINSIKHHIIAQNTSKMEQVNAMIEYVENSNICRSIQLIQYFGESDGEPCGHCNVCKSKGITMTTMDKKDIRDKIINELSKGSLNSRELVEKLNDNETHILNVLQLLCEHTIIKINSENKYQIIN